MAMVGGVVRGAQGRGALAGGQLMAVGPRLSLHAFRASRRREAIERKAAVEAHLRQRLRRAEEELAWWWSWWVSWSSWDAAGCTAGSVDGATEGTAQWDGHVKDAGPAAAEALETTEQEKLVHVPQIIPTKPETPPEEQRHADREERMEPQFLLEVAQRETVAMESEGDSYDTAEAAEETDEMRDYWIRVKEIATATLAYVRGEEPWMELDSEVESLVMLELTSMGATLLEALRVNEPAAELQSLAIAAARALAEEEGYVRRGDSPPSVDEDGMQAVEQYYQSLVDESLRLLHGGGPPPPSSLLETT